MSDPLALPIATGLLVFGYVLGTTRLAALLIYPATFAMPRGTRWMLVDNPIAGQQYGRVWALIGNLVISIGLLVPLFLGLYVYPGQFPPFVVVWSVATVAWTVIIVVLAVRTRSRFNRGRTGSGADHP
jgi:hypothetical protein